MTQERGTVLADANDVRRFLIDKGLADDVHVGRIEQISGGVSARTYAISRPGDRGWVLKQARAALDVPGRWLCDPRRVHREAAALRWLYRHHPESIVAPVHEDWEHDTLIMDAAPEPHTNWKTALMGGAVESQWMTAFAELLADIHTTARSRFTELPEELFDTTFFEDLRMEPYYEYSAVQIPEAAEYLGQLVSETRQCVETLVHGDASPKNVLLGEKTLYLLDHEVAHVGDPMFDVGFFTAHLLSKANHMPDRRSELLQSALRFWEAYVERAGGALDDGHVHRSVSHALGCALARVAGRSRLEYLDGEARDRQRVVSLNLMMRPPPDYPSMVIRFIGSLG